MPKPVVMDRDHQTVRTACGVRMQPTHWANRTVHSFRTWTGEHMLVTWCGLDADLESGARQTTDTITCLACGQASWEVARRPL